MEFDKSSFRRAAVLTTAAVLVSLEAAGCGKSGGSDPNAAPYGASASPSVATVTGPAMASAAPPSSAPSSSAPPVAAASVAPPTDPVGPDTKVPAMAPPAASPGDKGSDVTAPPMSAPGPAGGVGAGGGPMMGMGGGGSPTAPLTPTPEFDAKIAAAEKSGKKTDIGSAYALRGTFRMNDPDAGARVKYRAALEDYRKALAADPKNEEAKHNKELIEGIYTQMGRPIPQ